MRRATFWVCVYAAAVVAACALYLALYAGR